MVALFRAETRTGADYYVGSPEATDLEKAFRLEVSGIDKSELSIMKKRLREKEAQALRGGSSLPAYVSVVGFREARILLNLVEDHDTQ